MGKSLKEALLDQYALLQERGLAPSELPPDDEAPLVVVESAPRGRVPSMRREYSDRTRDIDELGLELNAQFERDTRRVARRDHHPEEARERRRPRTAPRGRAPKRDELEFPAPPSLAGADRPRPQGGPRIPGAGPGRPAPMGGPRPPLMGRTALMQQRAELRRRDDEDIAEMRRLLGGLRGEPMDDPAMDDFSRGLEEETGALPPPHIVVEAIRESNSGDPRIIADAVRRYYRRARAARPAAAPPRRPVVAATA